MSPLVSLLLATAVAPAVEARPAERPRAVVIAVRAEAEVLRAERSEPRLAPGGLARKVTKRADGQRQVEFE